jgi:hypothetical protein
MDRMLSPFLLFLSSISLPAIGPTAVRHRQSQPASHPPLVPGPLGVLDRRPSRLPSPFVTRPSDGASPLLRNSSLKDARILTALGERFIGGNTDANRYSEGKPCGGTTKGSRREVGRREKENENEVS